MWKRWIPLLPCGSFLVSATMQSSTSNAPQTSSNDASVTISSSDPVLNSFLNMCHGQPTASVSCGSEESEEHPKEIEIRVIYWLTTQLPFYKETVQYDVLQYQSTAITTATRTVSNNATALDMLSYTSLIPSAQAAPSGPYIVSEVGAVYGTVEQIGTATITYPTPYALIVNRIHVHQMGMCENGTEFSTSAWFDQPPPIPLPTALNYQNMSAEVNLTIPDFNDAFHSLHPRLSYCSFSSFSGQPLPKIVVDTASAQTTSASTITTTGKAMVQSAAAGASATTTGDARLSSAAGQIASLASYIACGLGGSCASSTSPLSASMTGGATDSHGHTYFFAPSTAPTVATLGQGDVPLYTADNGAVVVPAWKTLSAGAAAVTVGDAVMSVGTGGAVVVDGNTVARGKAVETGTTGETEVNSRSTPSESAGLVGSAVAQQSTGAVGAVGRMEKLKRELLVVFGSFLVLILL